MNEKKYIEKIINEYETKEPSKLDKLKELDKKVKKPAVVFAYVFGSIASLILGTGMCLAMNIIGNSLIYMIIGIIIGIIGIIMVSINHLIYFKILNKRKAKFKDEIIEISNQLLNKNEEI